MTQTSPTFSQGEQNNENGSEETIKRTVVKLPDITDILKKKPIRTGEVAKSASPLEEIDTLILELPVETGDKSEEIKNGEGEVSIDTLDTTKLVILFHEETCEVSDATTIPTAPLVGQEADPIGPDLIDADSIEAIPTHKLSEAPKGESSLPLVSPPQPAVIPRSRALLLVLFLLVLIINATMMGSAQFMGAQGWAYILSGPGTTGDRNLLKDVANKLRQHPAPGVTAEPAHQITPQEYIDAILHSMTLDQKLGQMMIVQFYGPDYGLDLSTMITQYNVGAILIFSANRNIYSQSQLKGLIREMQSNSTIPLVVAIDQEGGTVDRLISLDGPRPSATAIGATNDPKKAMAAGVQDAKDLSSYGINLNLAPVVDVNKVYNYQLYLRTFGNNPQIVSTMAEAYLQGLQQSGAVVGTLKHFPGLGEVAADPHNSVPYLSRPRSDLETIDWAPYRTLIQQGNVHAVMVTHEIVTAIDSTKPSSLSYKLVTGILRNELGFQGVVITDSLTMEGIIAYYSEAQAAALAVEAGDDLLMGAYAPGGVVNMINGIKKAISAGEISEQRIDDSVRRILMLKYQMGLLHIPTI